MKVLKVTGLVFLIVGMLVLAASCDLFGGDDGPDYSGVSVEKLAVADISGSFNGDPVANQTEFEDLILGPLLADGFGASGSMSSMLSSVMSKSADSSAREILFDESGSENETIDLLYDIGAPFTAGVLTVSGSYDVFGEVNDTTGDVTMDISADFESTLTNAAMTITPLFDPYYYTASGKANANILADFGMSVGGTEENPTLKIDLDYGVAFSLGLLIDVDGPAADGSEDVGAIVIMDLKLSESNHNSYDMTSEADFQRLIDDSVPSNATLNVAVYRNDHSVVFTESYDMAALELLMGL